MKYQSIIATLCLVGVVACKPTQPQPDVPLLQPEPTAHIFIIEALPENTSPDSAIYLAANINNWNPANPKYTFTRNSQGNYQFAVKVEQPSFEMQYKLTQGGWPAVECTASGNDIADRKTVLSAGDTTYLQVNGWKHGFGHSAGQSTAAKNVQRLAEPILMPQLNRNRHIWIYLPPDYHSSGKNYPVWYMHDAQNLFDESTGFAGEWGVDETLNKLFADGELPGIIIVGIENGGELRTAEYTPWPNSRYGGGEGPLYVNFLVETLKPYIDQNYRTLKTAENTGIMGSSLGALISMYAAVEYPNTFGRVGAFSSALWINDPEIFTYVENNFNSANGQKYYLLAGEQESSSMVADSRKLYNLLLTKGIAQSNLKLKVDEDGEHKEWYWKREMEDAMLWLNR
jgi:predicted alpha/beta superfamily hydrolase